MPLPAMASRVLLQRLAPRTYNRPTPTLCLCLATSTPASAARSFSSARPAWAAAAPPASKPIRIPGRAARAASTGPAALTREEVDAELFGEKEPAQSVAASPAAAPQGANPYEEASSYVSNAEVGQTDWSRSYHGLSTQPFPQEVADVLLGAIDPEDIEIKPDGLIYLPEIKYRRVLNRAFGPGGWGLAPRSETNVGPKIVSREYALVCLGRLVGIARGEQEYFDVHGIPTATEACKSNALMRCCKDLGIASELWDPRYIREFKAKHCVEVFVTHAINKNKKKLWRRKDQPKFEYPWKE